MKQSRTMIISRDYYEKMHDYFHPRFHDFIRTRFGPEDELIFVPTHHGCGLKNKNGSNKLIDYRNGERCYSPAWTSGKEVSGEFNTFPLTRYMSFYGNGTFFKNKGVTIFNYKTNRFDHLLDTPKRDNFERFFQLKELYLKSDRK